MKPDVIKIVWSWELPEKVTAPTLVIDADAATTNIAHMIDAGAGRLLLVDENTIDDARKDFPDALTIGEGHGYPREFFDSSNEAAAVEHMDIEGKTVLFMSDNGTHVIEAVLARGAKEVIAASFANMHAIVRYIQRKEYQDLLIVASGEKNFDNPKATEDILCAELIGKLLTGQCGIPPEEVARAKDFIRRHYRHDNMEKDIELVFQFNRYDVVPLCRSTGRFIEITNVTN
jgi:phosphosulfolactate phosphohydrolase-like enzyme